MSETRLATPPPPVRRRKRSECEPRILDAARQVFAEEGYEGATTREIARRADVSETLLFRYFDSKAGLFDRIVFAPVGGLMSSFMRTHSAGRIDRNPVASTREFIIELFALADENRQLLSSFAALRMLAPKGPGSSAPPSEGLSAFYELAEAEVRRIHAKNGRKPDVAPDIAVRLALGMVMSAVLFPEWLFAGKLPNRPTLVDSLARMLVNATVGTAESVRGDQA